METPTVQPNPALAKKINWSEIIWTVLSLVVLVILILKFVIFQQVSVVGSSMVPNYHDGDLLLVNQISKTFSRGQVVAVYADGKVAKDANYFTRFSATFFLKRIIGLPGESIEIVGSTVIIYNNDFPQGKALVESYLPQSTINSEENRRYFYPKTKITDKKYFVMGDNRSNSTDSRSTLLGTVDQDALFGQEYVRFWPSSSFSLFDLPTYTYKDVDADLLKKENSYFLTTQNLSY
jgi:signal peptidase I